MGRNNKVLRGLSWCFSAILCGTVCSTTVLAEPTSLMLSKNLCAQPNAENKVNFPKELVGHSTGATGIAALAERAEENREIYFDAVDETMEFSGLYLRLQADTLGVGEQDRSSIALEWELYNQGREESVKRLGKARLEHKVQYYQLLRDMEEKRLHENLFRLQQVRNQAVAAVYQVELATLQSLLDRRQQALGYGYETRESVAEASFKYERAFAQRKDGSTRDSPFKLSLVEYELIDQVDSLVLLPATPLLKTALEHSYEYLIQDIFVQRSEYFPTWTDDLSLGFYLENNHNSANSQSGIGVRARIPLSGGTNQGEIATMERAAYFEQQQAIALRLQQKIIMLTDRFRLKQADIVVLNKAYQFLQTKRELACYQVDYPVSVIDGTPNRKVDELNSAMFENKRDALRARLDLLEMLFELDALVKPNHANDLYQLM